MPNRRAVRYGLISLLFAWGIAASLRADDVVKQAAVLATVDMTVQQGPFRQDFASLSQVQVPDWYRDAKFGIFLHWGIYSVPAWDTEWYSHYMYQQGSDEYNHQLATWGPLTSFGYKDFIPMFTAGSFDPDAWVKLFKRCGVKFVVPVSEHHDGFSMWNNPLNSYNSVNMGPRTDVVGALATAVRKQGLAFGFSNHRAEHWWFYEYGMQDAGSDVQNSAFADLYGPAMPDNTSPDTAFVDNWLARAAASVDAYQPDLFYFDSGLGDPNYQAAIQTFGAHLYNRAAQWNQETVLTIKDGYPGHSALSDIEEGTVPAISPGVWQGETSVMGGAWGYITNAIYKDSGSLIHELVDDVSKNGVFLLNLGPKPDGTIPVEARQILEGMGNWLTVNGEAIYGTRPWTVFGEGPDLFTPQVMGDSSPPVFTGQDIRFTVKQNALYAILLAWPGSQVTIASLASTAATPVSTNGVIDRVQLLGYGQDLTWSQTSAGLIVNLPAFPPAGADYAYALKISGLKLPGIPADPNGTLRLSCGQAVLNQSSIQRFQYGLIQACYFDTTLGTATWTAHFNSPGPYAVTTYGSAAAGATAFQLTGCGQTSTINMNQTGDWDDFTTTSTTYINIPSAGDCDLAAAPYGPMNLAHIDFRPVALPNSNGSLHLTPSAATLNGFTIHVENTWGPDDIGYWTDGRESASWLVHFPSAGAYTVTAGFANGLAQHGSATIDIGGQPALASLTVDVKNTGAWNQSVPFNAGSVAIPQPGDYTVSVRAANIATWSPIDLYSIDFTPK